MTADFKKDLKRGQAGEERVAKLFPKWSRSDGRKEDFITDKGELVEVKTEGRSTAQTPNVALELESSTGRRGAIQRAVDDGISLVLYLFSDGEYFVYDAVRLLQFMKLNENEYRQVKIKNKTYETTVLIVPRKDLEEVEIDYEVS